MGPLTNLRAGHWPAAVLLVWSTACISPPAFGNIPFERIWFRTDGAKALTLGGVVGQPFNAYRWDVATGQLEKRLSLHGPLGGGDGSWFVTPDLRRAVVSGLVWNLETGGEEGPLESVGGRVVYQVLTPDGSTLYGITDRELIGWSVAQRNVTARTALPVTGEATFAGSFVIAPDGSAMFFFVGTRMGNDGQVVRATLPSLHLTSLRHQPTLDGKGGWTDGMAMSPDGRWLAMGDGLEQATLYDVKADSAVHRIRCPIGQNKSIVPIGFSRDGARLVLHDAPEHPTLCLVDVATGAVVATIPEPKGFERRAVFTVGGEWLVAHRRGMGAYEVYRLATGELVRTFCPLPAGCTGAGGPYGRWTAITPDGRTMFASGRGFTGAWDVATGTLDYWLADPESPRPWESRRAKLSVWASRMWRAVAGE